MSATGEDALVLLKSIDASLKMLCAHFGAGVVPTMASAVAGAVPAIAPDHDLDGKYGDPEVKAKSPRDWTGEDQTGRHFSECPAAYLDLVASRLDYFAQQNAASANEDDRKKAHYNRLDASRARGWSARIKAGYVSPMAEGTAEGLTADSIPF